MNTSHLHIIIMSSSWSQPDAANEMEGKRNVAKWQEWRHCSYRWAPQPITYKNRRMSNLQFKELVHGWNESWLSERNKQSVIIGEEPRTDVMWFQNHFNRSLDLPFQFKFESMHCKTVLHSSPLVICISVYNWCRETRERLLEKNSYSHKSLAYSEGN